MRGAPTRNWPGSFAESNRESQQRDLAFPVGGAISKSNSAQKPFDASGPLCLALGCAASAARSASNGTTRSTAGGPIAEGGDDAARFVARRRSDGGGQRSPPLSS